MRSNLVRGRDDSKRGYIDSGRCSDGGEVKEMYIKAIKRTRDMRNEENYENCKPVVGKMTNKQSLAGAIEEHCMFHGPDSLSAMIIRQLLKMRERAREEINIAEVTSSTELRLKHIRKALDILDPNQPLED